MTLSPEKVLESIQIDETILHDEWASKVDTGDINVWAAFESLAAPENRFILSKMGPLAGKHILDVGPGLGESSVYFALQGARVTAIDISPGMLERLKELACRHGVKVTCVNCAAESLNVPDNTFDFVYLGNIIHHVHNRRLLFLSMDRCT